MKKNLVAKPAFKRIAYCLDSAIRSKEIALLGLSPTGEITEDEDVHGYLMQKNVTMHLNQWLHTLKNKRHQYTHFGSLHEMIDIYGPVSLAQSEVILEWMVISGVIDSCAQLTGLQKSPSDSRWGSIDERRLFEALNGLNSFNQTNLVIDFRYNIIVTRINTRLSGQPDNLLAQFPILDIKKAYDLYPTEIEMNSLTQNEREVRLLQSQEREKAKTLSLAYIQQVFFPR
jgi:hypothetical protein